MKSRQYTLKYHPIKISSPRINSSDGILELPRGVSNSVKLSATNIKSEHRKTDERFPASIEREKAEHEPGEIFSTEKKKMVDLRGGEQWRYGHDIVADGRYIYMYVRTYMYTYASL